MLPLKFRLRYLTKLAQTESGDPAAPGAPSSPAAPASPTSPTAPTTPQSTTSSTIIPPPNFQASAAYGWMSKAYNSNTISIIDKLISLLNLALHYSSNGKFNFLILRNNSFQVDPSGATSVDTKNLLNLAILMFRTYLNNGNQFAQKVTGAQIHQWNERISTAQAFLNLSQLSPTGTIATKVPGNMRENVLNSLRELDRYNPLQAPQTPQTMQRTQQQR